VLTFVAMMIALADRVNLSVAAPVLMEQRGWDTVQMGWVFSGFFIGYSLMMIPAGIVADRFGAKWVLCFSLAWWSLFTALTPWPRSLPMLLLVRVLMGMGESGMVPCTNSILVRWFPRREYSRASAFCWSGSHAGLIMAFPLASFILRFWGWPYIFFAFACLGALWLPLWVFRVTDKPEDCPGLARSELMEIVGERPELPRMTEVPWRQILSCPAVYALMSLHFSFNWIAYVLASWLPTYLLKERHFSLSSMAIGSSLPFLSILIAGNVFGLLIDRYTVRYDRTRVRKCFLLAFLLAGAVLSMVPAANSPTMIVMLLCLGGALASAAYPIIASGSLDIAPRYSGTVVGFQNCVANFAGILVPVVTGYAVKVSGWLAAFWILASVCGAGFLVYVCFGQSRRLLD